MQQVRVEWQKIQFIKNFPGRLTCKSFRKYNVVKARYNKDFNRWMHYTALGIHFIPPEYVKIYKH